MWRLFVFRAAGRFITAINCTPENAAEVFGAALKGNDKTLENMVEEVIEQTIFFRTVGIIGALAVHSGEMYMPDDKSVKPMIICDI